MFSFQKLFFSYYFFFVHCPYKVNNNMIVYTNILTGFFFLYLAWQDVEKEKINGRSNILEYKRDNSGVLGDI